MNKNNAAVVFGLTSAIVLFGSGVAVGADALTTHHTASPARCHVTPTQTIASGDATKYTDGSERVCTDGVLVRVQHYGT